MVSPEEKKQYGKWINEQWKTQIHWAMSMVIWWWNSETKTNKIEWETWKVLNSFFTLCNLKYISTKQKA